MKSYKPNFIRLTTAVRRLQNLYGENKINRQLVLDMLEVNGVQPYKSLQTDDYYIDSFDYCEIRDYISDYPKGAPIDDIFDINLIQNNTRI